MKTVIIAISVLLLLVTGSCKKDDVVVTQGNVNSTITGGSWRVTYFFDRADETANFTGYSFVFANSGVLTASNNGTVVTGTWSTGTDDSQVKLLIDFGAPDDFQEISDDWHVIAQTSTKITLEEVSGGDGHIESLVFEKN